MTVSIDDVSRFWGKVDRSDGPESCWPWMGAVNGVTGYGVFHPSRLSSFPHTVSAHRFASFMAGLIDLGDSSQHVDHECHNRAECPPGPCPHRICCNPAHHKRTTLAENVGNSPHANGRKTHCPRNHEYTPENTRLQRKGNTTSRKCIACEKLRESARKDAA